MAVPSGVRAVLFDRDGTLVVDVPYNGDPARVALLPGVPAALRRAREAGLRTGIVSNQSGVARGLISPGDVAAVNARLIDLAGPFDVVVWCPHGEGAGCPCRKPAPGLVLAACAVLEVPPATAVVIGDIGADMEAARRAGAAGILVPTAETRPAEIADAAEVAHDIGSAIERVVATRACGVAT